MFLKSEKKSLMKCLGITAAGAYCTREFKTTRAVRICPNCKASVETSPVRRYAHDFQSSHFENHLGDFSVLGSGMTNCYVGSRF